MPRRVRLVPSRPREVASLFFAGSCEEHDDAEPFQQREEEAEPRYRDHSDRSGHDEHEDDCSDENGGGPSHRRDHPKRHLPHLTEVITA
jgi:hypothetical protein